MKIQQEKPSDYNEVYELVKISFATNSDDDGATSDYLNEVRKKDTFIPELSFVTEDDGKIIGQIVMYKMIIDTKNEKIAELLLSPILVRPEYFRKGIARSMIEKVFDIAKRMRYKAVFLCGNPELYKKYEFKPLFENNGFHILMNKKMLNGVWLMNLMKEALMV